MQATVNDKILLEGVQKVKEDDKIKYEYVSPKEVITHLRLKQSKSSIQ
jgi:membrane fusion protein (multidrug efflux system)